MRARILLSFIVCLLVGFVDFAAQAVESKKSSPEDAKVRSIIDKAVEDLVVRIHATKKLDKDVWKDIAKVEADSRTLRKREKRESEIDEIHMDSLLASLQDIPRDKKFVKDNCVKYKSQIIAEFSPYPKDNGEMPDFIKLTTKVLEALCVK